MSNDMQDSKTRFETCDEFIANGGPVEVLPYIEPPSGKTVNTSYSSSPHLMTLSEGEQMFGVKNERVKKKSSSYPTINMDLIPEHLRQFVVNNPTEDENKEQT